VNWPTPAPWMAVTMTDGSRNICGGDRGRRFVCMFSHEDGSDREECEANGRLIAAAPELLAMLKRVTSGLAVAVEVGGVNPGEHHAILEARALIAKATRGQS
jgi:hypothetical protein